MKGQSVRTFALIFSGLGSVAALFLLGALWLLQRVGGLGLTSVAVGQGLMVVSSLMGMLACYRVSRSLQLDREEEFKELLSWALCALLVPLVVDVQLALSAFLFPQPLIQLAQSLGVDQINLVLWVVGLCFGGLGVVAAGTVLYGVSLEPRWTLAYDCLIWLNFLLVLLGQAALICAVHLKRVSLLRNDGTRLEVLAGTVSVLVGYLGARAVQTASMLMLRAYVILAMICAGVGLVAAVFGWVAGVRVSTHLAAGCLDAMATAHSSQLEALECPAKYTNFSSTLDTLSCAKPEMRLAWEESLPDFACLNSSCCSQLPGSLEAVSESLSVQLLGGALAAGLAAVLVLALVRQLAYDDKDRFAGNCIFIGMLVSTIAVGGWLGLSSSYPSEMTAKPGSHAFSLPERLKVPGGCVSNLRLETSSCTHCKYKVTSENAQLYDGTDHHSQITLEGSQQEVKEALGRLVVCPECIASSMTVLVTAEGSSVPQVYSYQWQTHTSLSGTVLFNDEPESEVEVTLNMPGCPAEIRPTDIEGHYQWTVPVAPDQSPYNLTLSFFKEGFSTMSLHHTVGGISLVGDLPPIQLFLPSLLFSSVAVYFFDVVSNVRLSVGKIEVREGYNNATGLTKDTVTVVDGVGMLEELRPGVYTLVCSSPGYFSDITEVEVQPNSHQEKAALLSPIQPGLRIVMGWEAQRDLDLTVEFGECWVGFFNKACGDVELHADNQLGGSSGGEALTLNSLQPSAYHLAITTFRSFNESTNASLRFYWNSQLPFLRLQLSPDKPGLCLDGTTFFLSAAGLDGNCTALQPAEVSGWVSRPHK